jgi:hypothetical protein
MSFHLWFTTAKGDEEAEGHQLSRRKVKTAAREGGDSKLMLHLHLRPAAASDVAVRIVSSLHLPIFFGPTIFNSPLPFGASGPSGNKFPAGDIPVAR